MTSVKRKGKHDFTKYLIQNYLNGSCRQLIVNFIQTPNVLSYTKANKKKPTQRGEILKSNDVEIPIGRGYILRALSQGKKEELSGYHFPL